MKVERPMERLSEAPIRVNMESSTRIRAACAGTIDPTYAATNLLSLQPQQDPKRQGVAHITWSCDLAYKHDVSG